MDWKGVNVMMGRLVRRQYSKQGIMSVCITATTLRRKMGIGKTLRMEEGGKGNQQDLY